MKTSYMWVDPNLGKERRITGLRLPAGTAFPLMRGLGFDGVELMIGDPAAFDGGRFEADVRRHGLAVSQICTGELFGALGMTLNDPDEAARKRAVAAGETVVRMAGKFHCGVGIGRFRGGLWGQGGESRDRMGESLRYLDHVAREEGVTIALEPLRPDICSTLNTVAETAAAIVAWNLSRFGWLLDTDHVDWGQESVMRSERDSLAFVHLADSMHKPLGKGDIAIARYIAFVARLGYKGYCSVEVFPDEVLSDEMLLREIAKYLKKSFPAMSGGKGDAYASSTGENTES